MRSGLPGLGGPWQCSCLWLVSVPVIPRKPVGSPSRTLVAFLSCRGLCSWGKWKRPMFPTLFATALPGPHLLSGKHDIRPTGQVKNARYSELGCPLPSNQPLPSIFGISAGLPWWLRSAPGVRGTHTLCAGKYSRGNIPQLWPSHGSQLFKFF